MTQQPPVFHVMKDLKQDIRRIGTALWIFAGVQMMLTLFIERLAGFFWLNEDAAWITLVVSFVSGFCAILYLKPRFQISVRKEYGKPAGWKEILAGFSLMMLISFLWGMVQVVLDPFLSSLGLEISEPDFGFGYGFFENLILFFTIVIIGPVMEELVFRGLIYGQLRKYNAGFGMICSSFCFGLMHMNLSQGVPTIAMGLILAYFYEKSGSLKTSIGIHILNNLFAFLSMNFPSCTALSFVALALDVLAVIWTGTHQKEIVCFCEEQAGSGFHFETFVKTPAVLWLIVLFGILVITDFF